MISDSTSNQNSAFVSARLRWTVGFQESDIGNYTCMVRVNDTNAVQSKSVSLELTLPTVECSDSSLQTDFQICVLDADCLSWDENMTRDINTNFLSILKSIITAECLDCDVAGRDVKLVLNPPTCRSEAVVFNGSFSTEDTNLIEEVYCALNIWQQRRGVLVQINNRNRLVDFNCTTTFSSSKPSPITFRGTSAIVGSIVTVAVILVIFMSVAVVVHTAYKKTKKYDKRFSILSIFPGFDYRPSQVENITT